MNSKEHFNQKLLVEGNDDQHILWAICEKYKLPQNFDVIDCKGIDPLLTKIPVYLKTHGLQSIGIIIDADENLENRWNALKSRLSQTFPIPDTFPKEGLIVKNEEGIKLGVWIMPNNEEKGMIEDFIRFLIPEDDKLLPEINKFLSEIEAKGIHKYNEIHCSKAKIHAWLALQERPGVPMGQAITKRYLTTGTEGFKVFLTWLKKLFGGV